MQVQQIKTMGREWNRFLCHYDDCFGRSEPRGQLRTYIRGQLSDLPRKSVEPIALSVLGPDGLKLLPKNVEALIVIGTPEKHTYLTTPGMNALIVQSTPPAALDSTKK